MGDQSKRLEFRYSEFVVALKVKKEKGNDAKIKEDKKMTTDNNVLRLFTRIPSKDGALQERSEHVCFEGKHYCFNEAGNFFVYEGGCICEGGNPFVSILSKKKQERMLKAFKGQFEIEAVLAED